VAACEAPAGTRRAVSPAVSLSVEREGEKKGRWPLTSAIPFAQPFFPTPPHLLGFPAVARDGGQRWRRPGTAGPSPHLSFRLSPASSGRRRLRLWRDHDQFQVVWRLVLLPGLWCSHARSDGATTTTRQPAWSFQEGKQASTGADHR
jgi:hypothetical protein